MQNLINRALEATKRFFLFVVAVTITASMMASEKLIDHTFATHEYRWGNSRYDFHSVETYGQSYISLDEELNGLVSVSCIEDGNTFYLKNENLIDFQDSNNEYEIVYRYGTGELHITITNYQIIVSYFFGESFRIWKLH